MNSTKVIKIFTSIPEQASITYHSRFFNHRPLLLIITLLDRTISYTIRIILLDIELTGIIGHITLLRILEIWHTLVIFIFNRHNFIIIFYSIIILIIIIFSGANYNNRVFVPSQELQPPYPSLNKFAPFLLNFSGSNNYSPIPSTNLQPPDNHQSTNVSSQLPVYENQNSPNFQPLSQLTPPVFESNFTGRYPNVPSTNLEPPEFNNFSNDSSRVVTTDATQKIPPSRPSTIPSKKRFINIENSENSAISTTDPNVPTVWIDYENSSTIEHRASDIVEPASQESEPVEPVETVDVLSDKKEWKPVLVFKNVTETTTKASVIMKIDKKNVDVDLFNIDAAPFAKGKSNVAVFVIFVFHMVVFIYKGSTKYR